VLTWHFVIAIISKRLAARFAAEGVQMKKALLVLALAAVVSVGLSAQKPTVAGTWKVHTAIAGNESDGTCTFAEDAGALTGTCTGAEGKKSEIKGKVEGAKVTWSFGSEYNGMALTLVYTGTLDAGKITGTAEVTEFSVAGDFTATLSK
jgi:hypothetical protein